MTSFVVNGEKHQIKKSDRILFITGAGISKASGLPTYWGEGGVYERHTEIDIFKELSIENLESNPGAVWDVLEPIYSMAALAEPNVAHKVIARIGREIQDCMVYTQQLDRLHHKAGSNPDQVVEIHGTVAYADCDHCARTGGNGTRLKRIESVNLHEYNRHGCPVCPDCKSSLRPYVVPFGGRVDQQLIEKVDAFTKQPVDYVFIIGTRLSFTHMQHPVYDAHMSGAKIIIVNPEDLNTADNGFSMSMFDPSYYGLHARQKSEDFFDTFEF
ncbi:SIR2 family NAD-dependent protein deacylase [Vibrio harveyi]|uniref:SIR2 family NAD-dependent protein deacylase n=1 Tax=Vibrio harveyi TaxID=669 RepID=UPI003CF8A7F4